MTNQEIFNKVYTGVIAQGGPSINKYGSCRYRGESGRKCAAGHLILDEHYDIALEYNISNVLAVWKALVKSGIHNSVECSDFIRKLQRIHDKPKMDAFDYNKEVQYLNDFKIAMAEFAEEHSLSLPC